MSRKGIYHFFFPKGKNLPLKKFRWTCMVILQELRMCKFKAVLKFYVKPSYRKDIKLLRDILSKAPLKSRKSSIILEEIHSSHEINYPQWVYKLVRDYQTLGIPFKRIKVFRYNDKWIVIDGNHRLEAMKICLYRKEAVDVLILEYKENV